NLPTDYPRSGGRTYEGDTYNFKLDAEDAARFRAMGNLYDATLFMNLLAALYVLLAKYSGQEDIVIGCDIAGRAHPELHNVIGMFVNMLAMRNRPASQTAYADFLKEVKQNCIDAYENQEMQFEELVDKLKIERDPSRNPLFDVEFVYQNFEATGTEEKAGEMAGQLKNVEFLTPDETVKTTKFDLALNAYEVGNEIHLSWEYSTALFKVSTIKRISKHYIEILKQVMTDNNIALKDINILYDLVKPKASIPLEMHNDFGF
ncbi:MAG: hypothetical protein GY757_12310, partial [bacterium]|nr:hypothetical protein [bacterium]